MTRLRDAAKKAKTVFKIYKITLFFYSNVYFES